MRRRRTVMRLYERDGGWCRLCGLPVDPRGSDEAQRATIDHILPRSKGGKDNLENLQLAHASCNLAKGNNLEGEN